MAIKTAAISSQYKIIIKLLGLGVLVIANKAVIHIDAPALPKNTDCAMMFCMGRVKA